MLWVLLVVVVIVVDTAVAGLYTLFGSDIEAWGYLMMMMTIKKRGLVNSSSRPQLTECVQVIIENNKNSRFFEPREAELTII